MSASHPEGSAVFMEDNGNYVAGKGKSSTNSYKRSVRKTKGRKSKVPITLEDALNTPVRKMLADKLAELAKVYEEALRPVTESYGHNAIGLALSAYSIYSKKVEVFDEIFHLKELISVGKALSEMEDARMELQMNVDEMGKYTAHLAGGEVIRRVLDPNGIPIKIHSM